MAAYSQVERRYIQLRMNGQTGKFVGNLPLDKGAYWRWTGLIALIATVAALAVSAFVLLN